MIKEESGGGGGGRCEDREKEVKVIGRKEGDKGGART